MPTTFDGNAIANLTLFTPATQTPTPTPTPICQFSTSIATNFNGTAIHSGNYIWFNGVLKPSGLGSTPVTIHFTGQTITILTTPAITLPVPDADVTFDPSVTFATTTFSGGMWVTTVPASGMAGNTFFSALGYSGSDEPAWRNKERDLERHDQHGYAGRESELAMGSSRLHQL